jgi:hypothetical protein
VIKKLSYQITAGILVLMLFAHNINTLSVIGSFILNQDFIAKTLCIQKEEQKGCNGKCQLTKQLAESNSDSNSPFTPQETKRISLDIYCLYAINDLDINFQDFTLPKVSQVYNQSICTQISFDVETPPPNFS